MSNINFLDSLKKVFKAAITKPSTKELNTLNKGLDETYECLERYLTDAAYYNSMPVRRIKVDISKITEEGMKQVDEKVLKIHDLCKKYNAGLEIKGIYIQHKESKGQPSSVFIVMSQAWSYDEKIHPNYTKQKRDLQL